LTAEVAAVGNGDAQVINAPVVGINQTIHTDFYYSFSLWAGKGKFFSAEFGSGGL
jgi:hypothetical protein